VCASLLALVSCITIPSESESATDDQTRTQAEATGLGTILGSLIGRLSTRDAERAAAGTIAGELAGMLPASIWVSWSRSESPARPRWMSISDIPRKWRCWQGDTMISSHARSPNSTRRLNG